MQKKILSNKQFKRQKRAKRMTITPKPFLLPERVTPLPFHSYSFTVPEEGNACV
jgi:hypothetical protein